MNDQNKSGLYSGWVIDNSKTNPVQVWIPALVPASFIGGTWRCFGKNLLNSIGNDELNQLRSLCSAKDNWFYVTIELQEGANCNANWDESTGTASTNSHLRNHLSADFRTGKNLIQAGTSMYSNMPAFDNPFSFVGYYGMSVEPILGIAGGYKPEEYLNAPKGNWVKLEIGTRVICTFINGGSKGIILRQFPYMNEYEKTLLKDFNN